MIKLNYSVIEKKIVLIGIKKDSMNFNKDASY